MQAWLDRARTHAPVLFLIHTGNAHFVTVDHLLTAEAYVLSVYKVTAAGPHVFKPHVLNDFVVREHYNQGSGRMPETLFTLLHVLQYKHDLALIRNVKNLTDSKMGLPERMTSLPTVGEEEPYSAPVWNKNCGLDWGYII